MLDFGVRSPCPQRRGRASADRPLRLGLRAAVHELKLTPRGDPRRTATAAEAIGLTDRGVIGRQAADLLVVEGDPTADISARSGVRACFRRR